MRSTVGRLCCVAALALIAVAACGDELFSPPAGFGVVDGRWNGENWDGYGYAVVVNDTLHLIGRQDISAVAGDAQEVRASVAFTGVGTYELDLTEAAMAEIVGRQDVSAPRATGQLRIDTYDGIFMVGTISLTAESPVGPWRFENGTFDVPVFMSFGEVPSLPVD